MKSFKEWLSIKEVEAIVSCRDLNNPNFQISGALSDLNCRSKKKTSNLKKAQNDHKVRHGK